MELNKARSEMNDKAAIQGNMDPTMLFANNKVIKEEVKRILNSYGNGSGHIFNLGHGILPTTDPDKVKAFVNYVKEESVKYHFVQPHTIR